MLIIDTEPTYDKNLFGGIGSLLLASILISIIKNSFKKRTLLIVSKNNKTKSYMLLY